MSHSQLILFLLQILICPRCCWYWRLPAAVQYQLINESIYVALIVMALVTSMVNGPAMQRLIANSTKARATS